MGDKELDHTRRLRSDYGSLLYACRPYPGMKPYVKVLDYNSICGVPIETSEWRLHPYSGAYDEVREKLLPNQKLFSVCCGCARHMSHTSMAQESLRNGRIVRVLELIKEAAIFLPPEIAN